MCWAIKRKINLMRWAINPQSTTGVIHLLITPNVVAPNVTAPNPYPASILG